MLSRAYHPCRVIVWIADIMWYTDYEHYGWYADYEDYRCCRVHTCTIDVIAYIPYRCYRVHTMHAIQNITLSIHLHLADASCKPCSSHSSSQNHSSSILSWLSLSLSLSRSLSLSFSLSMAVGRLGNATTIPTVVMQRYLLSCLFSCCNDDTYCRDTTTDCRHLLFWRCYDASVWVWTWYGHVGWMCASFMVCTCWVVWTCWVDALVGHVGSIHLSHGCRRRLIQGEQGQIAACPPRVWAQW